MEKKERSIQRRLSSTRNQNHFNKGAKLMNNYTIHFNRAFEESHTVKADSVEEAKKRFFAEMESEQGEITSIWNITKEEN